MILAIYLDFFRSWKLVAVIPRSYHLDCQQSSVLIGTIRTQSTKLEQFHLQLHISATAQSEKFAEIEKAARIIQEARGYKYKWIGKAA